MNEEQQPMQYQPTPTEESMGFGYFQAPQKVGDETIKWQLDPVDVIEEIEYYLKAYMRTPEGWKPNDFNAKPMMTAEGINCFLGTLRNYLNKNVVLSNLTETDVKVIMRDVCRTLRVFLVSNHKQFEIKKKNWDQIKFNAENQIFAFLLRAKDNGERLRWMKTQQIMEQHTTVEETPKKKFGLF